MLSVLIPVYNFDVRNLVEALARQCISAEILFEIIVLDDSSAPHFKSVNRAINTVQNVVYEELKSNIGRAAIRNLLADKAKFEWLLFLDCDSGVVKPDFIQHYLENRHPNSVIYGGTAYADEPPGQPFRLHWKYGKIREALPVGIRRQSPYRSFKTNNFFAPRAVFTTIRFDEKLKIYGHEDSLFAAELEKSGLEILHLDNPVAHLGLEPTPVFLEKTKSAVQNLSRFAEFPGFRQTKLVKAYRFVEMLGMNKALLMIFHFLEKHILKQLHSPNPRLIFLDFFKLGCLLEILNSRRGVADKKF